jgi:hypothetical protein
MTIATPKITLVLDDIDKPIKGAEAIRAARGNVETLRQTFYALENGHIPARKRGRIWETTLRLLMNGGPTPASTIAAPPAEPPLQPQPTVFAGEGA